MKTLKEIHAEAVSFVDENWSELNPLERRITVLATIKALIELEKLKLKELIAIGPPSSEH